MITAQPATQEAAAEASSDSRGISALFCSERLGGRFRRHNLRRERREFAEDVWTRHRNICDIMELVRDSLNDVPAFPAARTEADAL